ncbi:MAG: Cof-type HAD-IIB family hydrolase [Lachnospiraceae bacterium]|nr:Cof-type HAD-IIB family hydrolase [Lachnospiraceae bacterium]
MIQQGKALITEQQLAGVKLLALDLDGTVLTDEKHITKRMDRSIRDALDAGLEVVLVTGRPLSGIPDELLAITQIRYAISSNGAVTTDRLSGQRLRGAYLDDQAAKEIARIPMERNLIHSVFIGDIGYCEQCYFKDQWNLYMGTKHEPYIRKSRKGTDSIDDLIDQSDVGVENIWFMTHSREERDELDRMIHNRWEVQTVLTAITDVEIGSTKADKGLALDDLSGKLEISREHILAIGDNENDLGMLRAAGITVAMGNATESVKQIADIITDSNEEDGAAKVIEKILQSRK